STAWICMGSEQEWKDSDPRRYRTVLRKLHLEQQPIQSPWPLADGALPRIPERLFRRIWIFCLLRRSDRNRDVADRRSATGVSGGEWKCGDQSLLHWDGPHRHHQWYGHAIIRAGLYNATFGSDEYRNTAPDRAGHDLNSGLPSKCCNPQSAHDRH